MEIMFKEKLNLEHLDVGKRQALSQKVFEMMKDNPAEVYRILKIPDYSVKSINASSKERTTEWSEQHEQIFAELNKRSFTVSSLAKSLTFKDMLKMLPKEQEL